VSDTLCAKSDVEPPKIGGAFPKMNVKPLKSGVELPKSSGKLPKMSVELPKMGVDVI
jgi:hypothetical protein